MPKNVKAEELPEFFYSGKTDYATQVKMDDYAYKLGHDLGNLDFWYNTLSLAQRKVSGMRVIKESYWRGVVDRIQDKRAVNRLCIFIEGGDRICRGFFAHALPSPFIVDHGIRNGFRGLQPYHKTLVINDCISEELPNLSDDYITTTYCSHGNNPWWCGDLLIVNSKLPFAEWLTSCKASVDKTNDEPIQYVDRFYVCKIEDSGKHPVLNCLSPSKRGTGLEQQERLDRFIEIKKQIEKAME